MTDTLISTERIEQAILLLRGQKVMLDQDLAVLYGVETGALNRAVARNADRFPNDFMFQLTGEEFENLKCQFGMASHWGGRRTPPYAFTEQGVAMLSGVLRSPQAFEPLKIPTHSVFGVSQACLSFPSGRPAAPLPGHAPAIKSGRRLPARPLAGPALQRASLGHRGAAGKLMTSPVTPKRKIGFSEVREDVTRYGEYVPLINTAGKAVGGETSAEKTSPALDNKGIN